MIGSTGVVPLNIHVVAYNMIPAIFTVALGMTYAITIRIGQLLAQSARKAKLLAAWCMAYTVFIGSCMALMMHFCRDQVIGLFTKDETVIAGCQAIWPNVCIYIVLHFMYGINSGILRALKMQWEMAAIVIGVLWCGALTTIISMKDSGVVVIWEYLPYFYAMLNLLLINWYVSADWEAISAEVKSTIRNVVDTNSDGTAPDENTSLESNEDQPIITMI